MASFLGALPTQLLASLLTGNKQAVLTGAGSSSAAGNPCTASRFFYVGRGLHASRVTPIGDRIIEPMIALAASGAIRKPTNIPLRMSLNLS